MGHPHSLPGKAPLKLEAYRELQLAWPASDRFAGNVLRALINIDGGSIPIWVAGIDVIEHVVSIEPELRE